MEIQTFEINSTNPLGTDLVNCFTKKRKQTSTNQIKNKQNKIYSFQNDFLKMENNNINLDDYPKFKNEDLFIEFSPVKFKPFQIEALRWMHHIEFTFKNLKQVSGGILADEMGMGKTIVCLGMLYHDYYFSNYLQELKFEKEINLYQNDFSNLLSFDQVPKQCSLIVTTKTILQQWKSECLNKFKIPEKDIFVYHGSNRFKNVEKLSSKPKFILTNYDSVMIDFKKHILYTNNLKLQNKSNDLFFNFGLNQQNNMSDNKKDECLKDSFLFGQDFHKVFLDEAHVVRNRQKICFESCSNLKTKYLYCVTGTPIFNSNQDLKSLSLLCTPFYNLNLKDSQNFIHWKNNFLLRRFLKDDDLPLHKVEMVWVEFSKEEEIIYNNIKKKFDQIKQNFSKNLIKNEFLNKLDSIEIKSIEYCEKQSGDEILSLLIQLRQVSLHYLILELPKWILNQNWENNEWSKIHFPLLKNINHSAKTRKIIEIIKKHPNEKITIFSQFTCFLDLVRALLKKEFNKNVLLYDGRINNTTIRNSIIHEFDTNKNQDILLLSLKAAYAGLNLVSASVAIICDPWYNFAFEIQAINRIHRFGQLNQTFVYRLFTLNSIDSFILNIQCNKNSGNILNIEIPLE